MNPMDTYEERNSPEFKPSTGDSNPISQKIRPACRRMGVAETPKSIAAPDELNVLPFQATLKVSTVSTLSPPNCCVLTSMCDPKLTILSADQRCTEQDCSVLAAIPSSGSFRCLHSLGFWVQVDEFLADTFMSLSEMFPNHFMDGAEKVAFIENGPTDTQCLVLRNSRLKEVRMQPFSDTYRHVFLFQALEKPRYRVSLQLMGKRTCMQVAIAFRGTEVSKPQDIWTDLQLTPSIFRAEGPEKDGEREPIFNSFFGGGNKPAVHSGFLKAWRSVQKAVEEVVECAADGEQGWKVYTCGHSLGGALAVLAAASYAAKGCVLLPLPHFTATKY